MLAGDAPADLADILHEVGEYYTASLVEHGPVARGVDWNSEASQELRFAQLMRILDDVQADERFSIADIGCGYGALLPYLAGGRRAFDYTGFDISAKMIETAKELHGDVADARFTDRWEHLSAVDFVVASGIFNVRGDRNDDDWAEYVRYLMAEIDALAGRGWAVNLLTVHSDAELMRDRLYYADPAFYFDWCKRRFSRHVALLHDYGLYEFTLLVRKDREGWDKIPR